MGFGLKAGLDRPCRGSEKVADLGEERMLRTVVRIAVTGFLAFAGAAHPQPVEVPAANGQAEHFRQRPVQDHAKSK